MTDSDPSGSDDPPRGPKVMRVKELAEYLKVHPSTIYRLVKGNAIPAFRIGSDWRFNLEEIDKWRLGSREQVDVVKRPSGDFPKAKG
jgi:excisionase family DNA binding protein